MIVIEYKTSITVLTFKNLTFESVSVLLPDATHSKPLEVKSWCDLLECIPKHNACRSVNARGSYDRGSRCQEFEK